MAPGNRRWRKLPPEDNYDKRMNPSISPPDSEPSATSLRALVTVARRLGLDVSYEEVRRRFATERGEPDTPTLIAIARELGLEARALSISFHDLPKVARTLPAILRAEDGGALLLEDARTDPIKGTVAVIREPGAPDDALLAVDELHLAEVWKGEVVLVKRRQHSGDEQQAFGMPWLVSQVLREGKLFREVCIAAFISTVFAMAPPFVFMIVLDRVLLNNSLSTLNVLSAGILILVVFETLFSYLRRLLTQVATTRIDGRLHLYIMERLLRLPMDYFEHVPTGQILSKLNQIWLIRYFLTGQLFGAFLDAVPLIGIIPAMFILEWHLAILALGLAAIIFLIVLAFMKPGAVLHRKVIIAEQARQAHLVETIYGIRTIKSLALEPHRRREWDRRVAEATATRHAFGLLMNWPQTLALPFQRLIYSGCLALGAYMVIAATPGALNPSTLTAGALVAFAMLSMRVAMPLVRIAHLQQDLTEVRTAVGQVASVVNVPPEETRSNGLRMPIRGEVSFKDVRFRYSPTAPYALDGVSFTVPVGGMLGIMGRSGSGKTTVTRLLQRLNSNYEGMIKIDGMDLREIELSHLRTHLGVVPPESFLFSGTIRENIAMAKGDATLAEVVRAAQLAGAEEFIEQLPLGYDTVLEEGAANLSSGQRQRIAIARALLINPPLLLLDEATSQLDAESEAIVSANLKRIAKGRTVVSISHRLSTLVECDAILVLERGKVYDLGSHEELVRRCDIYKHMWYQQNRHLDPRAAELPVSVARGAGR